MNMDEMRKKLPDIVAAAEAPTVAPAKPLASELIWGVEAVAVEVGLPVRVAYHLLRTGVPPGQKIGGKWCSSRSALHKQFAAVLGDVA
jgi:hypothetical protein